MQAVEAQTQELLRLRRDYDELYDRFKLAAQLHDDRERASQQRILELTRSLRDLQHQCQQVSHFAQQQKLMKLTYQHDVQTLREISELWERREKESGQQQSQAKQQIQHWHSRCEELEQRVKLLEAENQRMTAKLKYETVSKAEFDVVAQEAQSLAAVVDKHMVGRVDYEHIKEAYDTLQRRLSADYVLANDYKIVAEKLRILEQLMETEYVLKHDYETMYEQFGRLREEKLNLQGLLSRSEESCHHQAAVIEDAQQKLSDAQQQCNKLASVAHEKEAMIQRMELTHEKEVAALKQRHELERQQLQQQLEMETTQMSQQAQRKVEQLEDEIATLRGEYKLMEEQLQLAVSERNSLDQAKATCLAQLGKLKLQLRREQEAKQRLVEANAEMEKAMDSLRLDFATKLTDSNTKIHAVFALTEEKLQQRVRELEHQVIGQQGVMDSQKAEQERLLKANNDYERNLSECKAQLATQGLHCSQCQREKDHLQDQLQASYLEKQQLKEQLYEYQTQIEELRNAVLQELAETVAPSNSHSIAEPLALSQRVSRTEPEQAGGLQTGNNRLEHLSISSSPRVYLSREGSPIGYISSRDRIAHNRSATLSLFPSGSSRSLRRSREELALDLSSAYHTQSSPSTPLLQYDAAVDHDSEEKMRKKPVDQGIEPAVPSVSLPRTNTPRRGRLTMST